MQTQNVSQVEPLLPGLLKLSHAEKLQVLNILLREVAAEEGVRLDAPGTVTEEGGQQARSEPLKLLFAALDHGHNQKPVGRLRREERYDRAIFHRY